MESHRKNKNVDTAVTDGIHQTVFICDAATPLTTLPLQRLWLANARKWMTLNVFQQIGNAFQNTLVTSSFPIIPVLLSLFEQNYFHRSSMAIDVKFPSAISFSPWRKISTMAGEDMIYSVSSIACFFAVNFFRYFTAFCIRLSSSAIMLNSRNNSAFNCNAVINPPVLDFDGKVTT